MVKLDWFEIMTLTVDAYFLILTSDKIDKLYWHQIYGRTLQWSIHDIETNKGRNVGKGELAYCLALTGGLTSVTYIMYKAHWGKTDNQYKLTWCYCLVFCFILLEHISCFIVDFVVFSVTLYMNRLLRDRLGLSGPSTLKITQHFPHNKRRHACSTITWGCQDSGGVWEAVFVAREPINQ